MRFMPDTLFGRLFSAVLGVVAVAVLVVVILIVRDRRELLFTGSEAEAIAATIAETATQLAALSGDARTVEIERLTRDVGFTYRPSPKGFDHITQTTVIDGAGRVMLQVYGEGFVAPAVVEPLKRLVRGQEIERGTLAGLVRSVRLFCTIYDPSSGRYGFDQLFEGRGRRR